MNQNNTNTGAIDIEDLPDAWRKKAEAHETQPGITDYSYAHAHRDCADDLDRSLQADNQMTEYDDIKKRKFTEKSRSTVGAIGRIPSNAEIIHTEAAGGTGPLHVWYRIPRDDGSE